MTIPQGQHTGTLIKPHGTRGEMVMKGKPLFLENLNVGMPLFISKDGQRVPFFIQEIYGDSSSGKLIVKFEFIDSIAEAQRFISCNVDIRLDVGAEEGSGFNPNDFFGYRVIDSVTGKSGVVRDYIEHEGNSLLVLDIEGEEVLLPAAADYIGSIDINRRQVVVAFPDGLLGMQDS